MLANAVVNVRIIIIDYFEEKVRVSVLLTKLPAPGGYSGINVTGGVRRSLIFCTQKNTWALYCAPKKIQDWKLFESCFRILRELWLELRKNFSLAEIRTQKNTRRFFRPK